ncbi:hypothetical protein HYY71_04390 [Candidatus Woesearchaeota archaeon]|nr:hypothetical protein [Candidatus Woesearchaeota archaeon]
MSKIDKIELLKKVYSAILIPSAVKNEILLEGKEGYHSINNALESGWLKIVNPRKIINFGLGAGENQAISMAKERKDSIILDDAFAIKAAKAFNIPIVRTTTIIFIALNKRIINKPQALSMLNKLIESGYYISTSNYATLMSRIHSTKF